MRTLAALCFLLASTSLMAESTAPAAAATANLSRQMLEPSEFPAAAAALRTSLADRATYAHLSDADLATIDDRLQRMQGLLDGEDSVNDLGLRDKIALYNAQEEINALIEQRKPQRTRCERRKPLGSNLYTVVCETEAQRDAKRQDAQDNLRKPSVCQAGDSGC